MTKHTIYLLAFLNLIVSSCSKDWLDKKTSQDIAKPTTLKDFQALLDNTNSGGIGTMNTDGVSLGQIASDESYITDLAYAARGDKEKNAYLWQKQAPYLSVTDWNYTYQRIFVCNLILEEIEKVFPSSFLEKQAFDNIIGQSLFQRAKCFYELSQIWTPPYNVANVDKLLSIPLRLESDINIPSKRSSIQEMYDIITSDLLRAKNLLPRTAKYKTRGSKSSAFALLARVYLSMGKYKEAFAYSDSCLAISNELLDFNDLNMSSAYPIVQLNSEVIFHTTMISYVSVATQARIHPAFVDLYSTGDLRKGIYFGASAGLITFRGNYTGSVGRFNGLAVDEQYLIRAECYARAGNVAEAMSDLNTLLRSRWDGNVAYIDVTATDAEDALRKVLLERRKELLMRGLRWSDLRRLNQDPQFAITITRTVNGQTYTLEPNSYKYTFPIPDDVIQMSGIAQNPGWEK